LAQLDKTDIHRPERDGVFQGTGLSREPPLKLQ